MPLDFPTSPTNGQAYNGYVYNSSITAWQAKPAAQSPFYTSDTPPANPVVGDSWFNTNDGTMYVYYYDGNTYQWVEHRSQIAKNQVGLVPIVPTSVTVGSGTGSVDVNGLVTFTAASSVSLNNVFSSAYRDYRMVVEVPTATNSASAIGLRYRTGTADNSSNTYFQYQAMNRLNGAVNTNSGGPNTFYSLSTISTQTNSFTSWSGDIMMPYVTTGQTVANGLGMGSDATSSFQIISSVLFNSTTSFDGITLLSNAGTITGTVKIYGYN